MEVDNKIYLSIYSARSGCKTVSFLVVLKGFEDPYETDFVQGKFLFCMSQACG